VDDLASHLQALEEKLFDPAVRASKPAVESLLSAEFREIGSSGRLWTFEETIEALPSEPAGGRSSGSDFRMTLLGDGVALLTYGATYTGKDGAERKTLRSSIWRREADGCWRMVFHQGTLAR
jgi:hypothetical protein